MFPLKYYNKILQYYENKNKTENESNSIKLYKWNSIKTMKFILTVLTYTLSRNIFNHTSHFEFLVALFNKIDDEWQNIFMIIPQGQ